MSFFKYAKLQGEYFYQQGQKLNYAKNRYLVTMHDENTSIYFLISGNVRVSFSLVDGSERIIGYFLPGMIFAQSGSFYGDEGGALEYKAVSPVTVLRLPRQDFLAELKANQQLNAEYIDILFRNQIFLIDRVVYQGEHNVDKKFLRWLLFLVKYYAEEIDGKLRVMVPMSQDDMANFLHVTRVSINKAISYFTKQDLIGRDGKYLIIHDVQAIKHALS